MKKIVKKTTGKDRKFDNILGINIISSSTSLLLTRINNNLSHNKHFYIVTPNPELVLMAQDNPDLKKALNNSEFPIPDGVGLKYASKFLYNEPLNIIPGRKLFSELIKKADEKRWKVFFLGGENGEAFQAANKLKSKYKKIRFLSEQGPELDKNAGPVTDFDKELQKDAIDTINKFAPDLLFIAFGNPKQEIWIYKNIGRLRIGGGRCVLEELYAILPE